MAEDREAEAGGGQADPSLSSTAAPPDARRVSAPSINLEERQLALVEVFRRRSEDLAGIYVGALHSFYDRNNPDRVALTAHGIREVIMQMPKHFAVAPLPDEDSRLGDKVDALRQAWNKLPKKRPTGDPLPVKFVSRLEVFFAWLEVNRPRFKERTALIVRRLDPAGRSLPTPIEDMRIQEWNAFRTFFVRVAHHDWGCTDVEFDQQIERFEFFLLNLVRPRTFDNADLLDALIREGEGDG